MKHRAIIFFTTLFFSIVFSSCVNNDQPLYRIQQDGLYGFIDNQGKIVIAPQYKYVSDFSKDGIACVINEMQLESDTAQTDVEYYVIVNYGYINKRNQIIIDSNQIRINPAIMQFWGSNELFKQVNDYNDGLLSFRSRILQQLSFNNGLCIFQDEETKLLGYKDINNNIVIEPKYERCRAFKNGVAIVFEPMNEIINNVDFTDSLCAYHLLNKSGVINSEGKLVVDYEYCFVQDYMDNGTTWAATISLNENGYEAKDWVCIDKGGRIITGPLQSGAKSMIYNNEKFPIYKFNFGSFGTYFTFIDNKGNLLSDFDNDGGVSIPMIGEDNSTELFDDVIHFSDGVGGLKAIYKKTPGWYFVDSTLMPISKAYDSIRPFSESMAAVKEMTDGFQVSKWGFVKKDPSTNTVVQAIPFSFSKCGGFHKGLAYFSNEGNAYDVEGYINKNGDIVWQTKRKKF